jgi:thioredoxin-related protein
MASPLLAADVAGFESSYADALAKAKKQDKPLYLHFTTEWCSWCRKIEQDTYTDKKAKKALENFVPASLDCTVPRGQQPDSETKKNLQLMNEYGGRGYPYLVMVTPKGVVLGTINGYVPPERFVKELDNAQKLHERWKSFQKEAKNPDKDDLEFQIKAMNIYAEVNKLDKAVEAAKRVRKLDPENKKGHAAEAALVLLQDAWKSAVQAKKEKESEKANKRIDSLLAEIRKLDPKNEKGALQKALQGEAMRNMQQLQQAANRQEAMQHLQKASGLLNELTEAAKTLENKQQVYAMLGQTYMFLKQRSKAVESLKAAVEADPDSRLAAKLKQIIQKIEASQ